MTELERSKIIVGTFETEIGKKCLEMFKDTWLDKPMYKAGMSLDEVAFKQGRADVVAQILKEFKNVQN